VKKILSILLALGLVLGMVVAAMPAAAQPYPWGPDWTEVNVDVDPDCELVLAVYNITFEAPATLTQGVHSISVKFPEGTGYPAVWRTGHILLNGTPVFASEITQDGDVVSFLVPVTTSVGPLSVAFIYDAIWPDPLPTGIKNPPAGLYHLEVKTDRAPMSSWVKSTWNWVDWDYDPYIIRPTVSSYAWQLNFGQAYPGIAPNFVPPFKACGQDPAVQYNQDSDNPFVSFPDGDRFVTPFNLAVTASPAWFYGCQPCPNMQARIVMTGRPSTVATARLYAVNATAQLKHFTATTGAASLHNLTPVITLDPIPGLDWDLGFHFDTVGTYTFDFRLLYTGDAVCEIGCESVIRTVTFDVKQVKDAIAIPLEEKWNLISLPLVPFDSDIDAMLATMTRVPAARFPLSIWHYDAFDKEWLVYGGGQDSLTDIEDGKSYWFRMFYRPDLSPLPVGVRYWWVFGTEKPQPPAGPLQYQVAKGWNMAGFTSMYPMAAEDYLWNWGDPDPVIYGWTQDAWNVQNWYLLPFGDDLEPGQGYWMAFPEAGEIYVP